MKSTILYPEGAYKLGRCLAHGRGVRADPAAVLSYCQLAADRESAKSQYKYGIFFFLRTDNEQFAKEARLAADSLKLSADQGYAMGQTLFGCCWSVGKGVAVNKSAAAHYFKLSADQGNAFGQNLDRLSLSAGDGVPVNDTAAVQFFKLSADQGNRLGQCNYATCLLNGVGVAMNKSAGAYCFKLSADQGTRRPSAAPGVASRIAWASRSTNSSLRTISNCRQIDYRVCLLTGSRVAIDTVLGADYIKLFADRGQSL
jgi:TPR repeat protein